MSNPFLNGEGNQKNIGGKTELSQKKQLKSGQYMNYTPDPLMDSGADAAGKFRQAPPDLSGLRDTSDTVSKLMDIAKGATNLTAGIVTERDATKYRGEQKQIAALEERAALEGWSTERLDREKLALVDTFDSDDYITRDYRDKSDARRAPLVDARRSAVERRIISEEDAAATMAADRSVTTWEEYPDSYEVGGQDQNPAVAEITGGEGPQPAVMKPNVGTYPTSHEATVAAAEYAMLQEYGEEGIKAMAPEKRERIFKKFYQAYQGPVKKRRKEARLIEREEAITTADISLAEVDPEATWESNYDDEREAHDAAARGDKVGQYVFSDEYKESIRYGIEATKANGAPAFSKKEQKFRAAKILREQVNRILQDTGLPLETRKNMIDSLMADPMWKEYIDDPRMFDEIEKAMTAPGVAAGATTSDGTPIPNVYSQGLKEMSDELDDYMDAVGIESDATRIEEIIDRNLTEMGIVRGQPGSKERDVFEQARAAAKATLQKHKQNIDSRKTRDQADYDVARAGRGGQRLSKDETNKVIQDSTYFGSLREAMSYNDDPAVHTEQVHAIRDQAIALTNMPGIRVGDSADIMSFVQDAIINRRENPAQFHKAVVMYHHLSPSQQRSMHKALGDVGMIQALRKGNAIASESIGLDPESYINFTDPLVPDVEGAKVDKNTGEVVYDLTNEAYQEDFAGFAESWDSVSDNHPLGDSVDDGWFDNLKPNAATINNDPVLRDVFQRARDYVATGMSWDDATTAVFDEMSSVGATMVADGQGTSSIVMDPHEHLEFSTEEANESGLDVNGSLDAHLQRQMDAELDADRRAMLSEESGVELPDNLMTYADGVRYILHKKLNDSLKNMSERERRLIHKKFNIKIDEDKPAPVEISIDAIPGWNEWDLRVDSSSSRSRAMMDDPNGGMPVDISIPGIGSGQQIFGRPLVALSRRYGTGKYRASEAFETTLETAERESSETIDKILDKSSERRRKERFDAEAVPEKKGPTFDLREAEATARDNVYRDTPWLNDGDPETVDAESYARKNSPPPGANPGT